jgi:hypothetical protein
MTVEIIYTYKLGRRSPNQNRYAAVHPKVMELIRRGADLANETLDLDRRIAKVAINSGGQPAGLPVKGQGKRLPVITQFGGGEGAPRHDYGAAGDVWLYDGNGERLRYSTEIGKAAFNAFARGVARSGGTGIGFGYMGDGTIHVGFGHEDAWYQTGKIEKRMPSSMLEEIQTGRSERTLDAIVWNTNDEMTAQIVRLGFVDRDGLPDVKAFQRSVDLDEYGELDEKTLTHIYFANRDVAGQPAPSLALNPDLAIRPLRHPILGPNFHHVGADVMSSPYYSEDMLEGGAAKMLAGAGHSTPLAPPTSILAAPESYVLTHPARLAAPEKHLDTSVGRTPSPPTPRARPNPLGAAMDFFKAENGIGPSGDKESVKAIQQFLAARGWTNDKGDLLTADGDFGPSTEQALVKYQSQFPDLADRGTVGPQTLVRMLRDNEGLDFMTRLPRRSDVPEPIRRAAEEGERFAAYLMHPDKAQRDFHMARDTVLEFPIAPALQEAVEDYLKANREDVLEVKRGRRSSGEMPPMPKPAHQSWSSWLGDWFGWE